MPSLTSEQRFDCERKKILLAGIFPYSPLCVIKKLFIHEQSNTSVYEVYNVLTTSNIDRGKYVSAIFATHTLHDIVWLSTAVEGKLLCHD